MKIILRDIFQEFFTIQLTLYESLTIQQKQSIIRKVTELGESPQQQQQNHLVSPQLNTHTSSWYSKQKKQSALNVKGKFKQDVLEVRTEKGIQRQKSKHEQNDRSLMIDQKQRLRQLLSQRLQNQIIQFVKNHRFYSQQFNISKCIFQLSQYLLHFETISQKQKPRLGHQKAISSCCSTQQIQQNLYKLSLYLNRQTNKQIFTVYQLILSSNPKTGISYDTLARRLKTDIINVSHYCCKLKKMRFIDWEHKKQGIAVFPKLVQKRQEKDFQLTKIDLAEQSPHFDYHKSFIFNQLTLNENILINIASSQSLLQGGLTNEEIKFKIMKHAENKMVRRTVEGMKHIEKNAQRQGKVFEFKYKKETSIVTKEMDKKRLEVSGINTLTQRCRQFLNSRFQTDCMNKKNQELLQYLVNTKLKDYISSIGIKQSKRQCTPLKLNRYINILNFLQIQGPETELDLRRRIIDIEKELQSNQGIIHKRSVLGILQGLKKIELVEQRDGQYYPKWCEVQSKKRLNRDLNSEANILQQEQSYERNLCKKVKLDKKSKQKSKSKNKMSIPQQKIRMITKKEHLNEIFSELLNFTFDKAIRRILRKGFHRIMFVHRKKQSIPTFVPQQNIFHLLDSEAIPAPKPLEQYSTTLQSFMSQISIFIEKEGKKLQNFPEVQYPVVKSVRRNPTKNADNLRSKYGKNWSEKFSELERSGVIKVTEKGYETLESFRDYLV